MNNLVVNTKLHDLDMNWYYVSMRNRDIHPDTWDDIFDKMIETHPNSLFLQVVTVIRIDVIYGK